MNDKCGYSAFDPGDIHSEGITNTNAPTREPLVSVKMITYNHEPYIAQAIKGALRQETSFPFELVIGEDCSTDGTREIVFDYQKKYPDIIRVITSDQNVGMHKNGPRTLKECRGKYIAYCEGDDYWHHPQKLQKQVDFLEANPGYGLVHSDYDMLTEKTGRIIESVHKSHNTKIPTDNFFEELLVYNFIATLTVCARTDLVKQAITDIGEAHRNWISMMMDCLIWMEIARHAKIGYISESLAVRRILPESAMHSSDKKKNFNFHKSSLNVRFYFIDKYGCSSNVRADILKQYHRMMLWYSFLLCDKKNAKKSFQFLNNVEEDLERRKRNYYHYLGSKNKIYWIFIKLFLKLKKVMSNGLIWQRPL